MPDAGASPLIKLTIDRKAYRDPSAPGGEAAAVLDLALTIWPGEILCLVGPSGCGKTTALRILLGLDRTYEGRVEPDPDDLPIRIMFQEPRLLPWRSVEDNIRLVLPPRRRRENIDALCADIGIEAWRRRHPGELSLGLARRVALARALVDPPRLLILDEPFVSLDEHAVAGLCRVVVERAVRDKIAIVLVTHNIREALAIADRVVVLSARPARVLGETTPAHPRGARSAEWIEQERRMLAERFLTIAP